MKKSLVVLSLLAALSITVPNLVAAQAASGSQASAQSSQAATDQDIKLLQSDVRSAKKQIVAANMTLTDKEAEKFWPVYDAYTQEMSKLNDKRVALIKEYADNYNNMTDAQANSLMKQALDLDAQYVKLRQSWVPKFEKVISPKQTATFFQIDRRLALIINLQLASNIPLMQQQ